MKRMRLKLTMLNFTTRQGEKLVMPHVSPPPRMWLPTYGDNIRLAPLCLELGLQFLPKSYTTYLLVLVLGHLSAAPVIRKKRERRNQRAAGRHASLQLVSLRLPQARFKTHTQREARVCQRKSSLPYLT
jgi:hypothetical protein